MSTRFKHKTQNIEISYSEYCKLEQLEKNNFNIVNENNTTIINNSNVNKTDDLLGIGKVAETAACVVLAPLAILGFFD